jgi:hypothetical protein
MAIPPVRRFSVPNLKFAKSRKPSSFGPYSSIKRGINTTKILPANRVDMIRIIRGYSFYAQV